MSKEKPTNGELAIMLENLGGKIDGFIETHDDVHKTFTQEIFKNTKFRWIVTGIAVFITTVGITNVVQAILN